MADEWYVEIEGETRGPIGMEELKRLASTGRIGPGAMVRHGRDEWVVAQRVPGLFDGIAVEAGSAEVRADRLDDPGPDEDYRLPPVHGGGRFAVSAYGVATIILASVLSLIGCVSGVGSAFCFTGFSQLQQTPPPSTAPGAANGAAAVGAGCGSAIQAVVAGVLLALAIVLAVVMVIHLLLGGGHFTAGAGVLRRRPWSRILALVLSVLTGFYGLLGLYGVVDRLFQSPAPTGSEAGGLVLAAGLALLFTAHAVLTWVVMFHPACSQQFRSPGRFYPDDDAA